MNVAVVVLISSMLALALCAPPPRLVLAASAAAPMKSADVVGAWNGQWAGPAGAQGMVELVLARAPGRDAVVGQFTFLSGGTSRTLRYEGQVEDGILKFELVGDGRIVLEPRTAVPPGAAVTLRGDWVDARGALPAPRGTLDLSRVAVR
jgi:hypothetical protein